ncbi:hypothetical protein RRG08_041045 [Elysia crispata]|uniref:Uncharacterized protein n=1 Tax=Elysia crispata TaxID=231223 RepID=A0AAE0Y7N8_9GAST|nr:hypothetical protein RRG08_041045 [Elysia crispata]
MTARDNMALKRKKDSSYKITGTSKTPNVAYFVKLPTHMAQLERWFRFRIIHKLDEKRARNQTTTQAGDVLTTQSSLQGALSVRLPEPLAMLGELARYA